MKRFVFENFSSNERNNGFLEDCSITFIEKTDRSDPTTREEYWRRVLKTVIPYGLSTRGQIFGQMFKLLQDFMYFSREGCLHRKIHTSDIYNW